MPGQVILKKRPRSGPLPPPGDIIVTCAAGAAEVLSAEIEELGERVVRTDAAAVRVAWQPGAIQRLNRQLRTASRVLLSLVRKNVESYDDVYHAMYALAWDVILPVDQTFAISASTRSAVLSDHRFLAMRVKDAICDRQRATHGRRSSVDRNNPGLAVTVFADETSCELSLDSSGAPLHERGWRTEAGEAPLRETVAALMLLSAGWPRAGMLLDPFCGSGTIAIEAALIAAGREPWAAGRRFAWQRWRGLDGYLGERDSAQKQRAREERVRPVIWATDNDPAAIDVARRNAERAGVVELIHFEVGEMETIMTERLPGGIPRGVNGLLLTNPPYGQRLNPGDLRGLYRSLGEQARAHIPGWQLAVIAGNASHLHELRLKAERTSRVYNGGLLCDFSTYRIRRSTETGK